MRALSTACAMLFCGVTVVTAQQPTPRDTTKKVPADSSVAADSAALQADPGVVASAAQTPARVGTYMNMGFDALLDAGTSTASNVRALQRGDHDPAVRGFTMPN